MNGPDAKVAGAAQPVQPGWRLASGFVQRLRGLLGRAPPVGGTALLIPRCAAVHTVGMRYAIDIVFLARDGTVLRLCPTVMPQRARMCRGAWAVAELAAGEAGRLGIETGMRLVLPSCIRPSRMPGHKGPSTGRRT